MTAPPRGSSSITSRWVCGSRDDRAGAARGEVAVCGPEARAGARAHLALGVDEGGAEGGDDAVGVLLERGALALNRHRYPLEEEVEVLDAPGAQRGGAVGHAGEEARERADRADGGEDGARRLVTRRRDDGDRRKVFEDGCRRAVRSSISVVAINSMRPHASLTRRSAARRAHGERLAQPAQQGEEAVELDRPATQALELSQRRRRTVHSSAFLSSSPTLISLESSRSSTPPSAPPPRPRPAAARTAVARHAAGAGLPRTGRCGVVAAASAGQADRSRQPPSRVGLWASPAAEAEALDSGLRSDGRRLRRRRSLTRTSPVWRCACRRAGGEVSGRVRSTPLRQRLAGADLLEGEDGGLADGRLAVLEQREPTACTPWRRRPPRAAASGPRACGRGRGAPTRARASCGVERRPQPIERVRRRHRERRRRDVSSAATLAARRLRVAHPLDERRLARRGTARNPPPARRRQRRGCRARLPPLNCCRRAPAAACLHQHRHPADADGVSPATTRGSVSPSAAPSCPSGRGLDQLGEVDHRREFEGGAR